MPEKYDHSTIEKKWQQKWAADNLYKTVEDTGKKKAYVLDMFPYPSGEGLHVGHPKGYIATDIYSRYMRMQGKAVLHPMGWDAFGLPAENYALKNKVHPRIAVEKNIATFKAQLEKIGFDYDWSREINTTDPAYYKWTQWIFLKLFEKGLAYQSNEPINWCPSCMTGLANEDLEGGECERCGTVVIKKRLPQWVLKITDYADRLLNDLDLLEGWPEHIREMQKHWIGRKEGVVVSHKVLESDLSLDTFSAYPAWLFADTYLVLAPEHPLVPSLVKGGATEREVLAFVNEISKKSAVERAETKEKLGIFTGRYADNPFKPGEKMPIWLANFALMDFGTGAIRCSAHDERDVEFAEKYKIPLRFVVGSGEFVNAHDNTGILKDSGPFTGRTISPELIEEMVNWMVKENLVQRHVTYRLQDWVFSRQRYWGEPIPIIHCPTDGAVAVPEKDLPVMLPEVEKYEPSGTGESPLANIAEWVNTVCPKCGGPGLRETNTMPQWAGSSWYYLRYMDPHNDTAYVDPAKEKYWAPVDMYVGGAEHATRHLIYARFWHKFLHDLGLVSTPEPFAALHSVGLIIAEDGRKMSKRFGNVINPDDIVAQFGADTLRVYEMFMGPFENAIAWNTQSLTGSRRFIERVWRLQEKVKEDDVNTLDTVLHQTIKKIGEDILAFKFNTAVSQMMILLNAIEKEGAVGKEQWRTLLKLIAPFAPHLSEELWQVSGVEGSVHASGWPEFDPAKTVTTTAHIAVQINGKVRATLELPGDVSEAEALAAARMNPNVGKWLAGGREVKALYVPGRIVSFVIEPI